MATKTSRRERAASTRERATECATEPHATHGAARDRASRACPHTAPSLTHITYVLLPPHARQVEISFLLTNFAFTKWFEPHINGKQLHHIKEPLVWRHTWVKETQTVLCQYKAALSDTATFEKDEWGPWVEQWVLRDDPETGRAERVRVLRSDPKGVNLMHSYPDIYENPGVEPWYELEKWSHKEVFEKLKRWQYCGCDAETRARCAADWASVGRWHLSHPTSDSVLAGVYHAPRASAELHTPPVSYTHLTLPTSDLV